MTTKEFENKYWHMSELKALAKSFEISFNSKIRKDQLEKMIIQFLETDMVSKKQEVRSKSPNIDILNNNVYVENFRNNKETQEIHTSLVQREKRKIWLICRKLAIPHSCLSSSSLYC